MSSYTILLTPSCPGPLYAASAKWKSLTSRRSRRTRVAAAAEVGVHAWDEEEIERFQKTLNMQEKGMVYVKGIFEAD